MTGFDLSAILVLVWQRLGLEGMESQPYLFSQGQGERGIVGHVGFGRNFQAGPLLATLIWAGIGGSHVGHGSTLQWPYLFWLTFLLAMIFGFGKRSAMFILALKGIGFVCFGWWPRPCFFWLEGWCWPCLFWLGGGSISHICFGWGRCQLCLWSALT